MSKTLVTERELISLKPHSNGMDMISTYKERKVIRDKEQWKPIKNYEGMYEISNFGRVKSLKRKSNKKEFIRKLSTNVRKGYKCITLTKNSKRKTFTIHRLVALHFIPNPENKPQVNHKDGVKKNNYAWNFEWVTNAENRKHAMDNGIIDLKGENGPNAKLKNKDVFDMRKLAKFFMFIELAIIFNVHPTTVFYIVHGKTWKNLLGGTNGN